VIESVEKLQSGFVECVEFSLCICTRRVTVVVDKPSLDRWTRNCACCAGVVDRYVLTVDILLLSDGGSAYATMARCAVADSIQTKKP